MAKSNTSNSSSISKVTFGKKSLGRGKKRYGPKAEKPKPYKGQGR